jgi:hypothetical protein
MSTLDNLYPEDLYQFTPTVLVVLSRPWASLSEQDISLLSKILSSVKLSLASVHIIARPYLSSRQELDAFSPEKIVAFGISNPSLKPYEQQSLDGIPIVLAEDFPMLDDTRKRALWLALKAMFGL